MLVAPKVIREILEHWLHLKTLHKFVIKFSHSYCILIKCNFLTQDLHPGNILLGSDLHLRLTYQCEWVSVDQAVNWESIEMVICLSNSSGSYFTLGVIICRRLKSAFYLIKTKITRLFS